jgi:3-dehydroquinate synthase
MNKSLFLAGFMGTGKTTVGRLCAQALGVPFIDADEVIEQREGMRIAQVFEQKGEAYFRQVEAALVQELAHEPRAVIATGGGMIVDAVNRRALLNAGVCVGLTASPDAILSRVDASTRPMLRGDDPRRRIAALLKERAAAYGELHYTLDTSACPPEQSAAQVLSLYRTEQARITVNTAKAGGGVGSADYYDIVSGAGVLDHVGEALVGRGGSAPFAIVSDDMVGPLYAERVRQSLQRAGINAFVHCMPAGESHKTLHTVEELYRAFSANGLERNGMVIAVGGGVVGDVAGFAAATYLRGVPFVQVPTTLLAMADSSIGGKVGVDTPFGKNLVGAFKQPALVLIDTSTLRSLPPVELRCGYAEIVKAALIAGGEAYERIRAGRWQTNDGQPAFATTDGDLLTVLRDAIELKRRVVEEDPFEQGRRALLNLGHTFGHGLEAWSQFRIRHGEGVALGMLCAVRLSHALGLCDAALADEVIRLLADAGLPVSLPRVDTDAIWPLMQSDKKKRGGKLRFVLLRAPGECFLTAEVTENQARQALQSLAA